MMTIERAVELHKVAIARYGGALLLNDEHLGKLQGCLNQAKTYVGYLGKPDDPVQFAAACLRSIVQTHPMLEGNKRTGWMVAIDVLRAAGLGVRASHDEAVAFCESVINDDLEPSEVADWFAQPDRLFVVSD